jgi:putative intracellular protease/amidase
MRFHRSIPLLLRSSRNLMIGIGIIACGLAACSEGSPGPAIGLTEPARRPPRVAIVVYHGVDLLDVAAAARVFTHAFDAAGDPLFEVAAVASDARPIGSLGVVKVIPRHDMKDTAPPHVLVIPGGMVESVLDDVGAMEWIKSQCTTECIVLAIGSGASVLGRLGMLEGRRVATHHDHAPRLAVVAPKAVYVPDARFVDHGRLITAAGVTGGIDASLHIVARMAGPNTARRVATDIEYDHFVGQDAPAPRVLSKDRQDGLTLQGRSHSAASGAVTKLVATITGRGIDAAIEEHAVLMAAAAPSDRPLLGKESLAATADWLRRYGTSPNDAIAVMRFNVRAYPRFVAGHLQLAETLFSVGDAPGAAAACEQALAIDPRCGRARAILEQCDKFPHP